MFEYTALVDAPVKRFTSIVTDPEPDELAAPGQVTAPAQVMAPVVPVAMPMAEPPVLIIAAAPQAFEPVAAEPVVPVAAEPVVPVAAEPVDPVAAEPVVNPLSPAAETPKVGAPVAPRRPVRAFVPRAEPAPRPSMVPTLIGIAAAGITAFWWMRRDSHPRGR